MKSSTQQIKDLISSTNFENIKEKLSSVIKQKNLNIESYQEYSVDELFQDLPYYKDLFSEDNGNLDQLSNSYRKGILRNLSKINDCLGSIYNGSENFNDLQKYTQYLKTIIISSRIDYDTKKIPGYNNKLTELKALQQEIDNLLARKTEFYTKLKEIEETIPTMQSSRDTVEEIRDSIEEVKSNIDKSQKSIDESCNFIEHKKDAAEDLVTELKESQDTINRIQEETEASKAEIQSISDSIESLHKEIETWHKNSNDSHSKILRLQGAMQEFYNSKDKTKQELDLLIDKASGLHSQMEVENKKLNELIYKATGNNLFTAFDKRKENLEGTIIWWIGLAILSALGLVCASIWLAKNMDKPILGVSDLIPLILIKLGITTPFITVIWFCIARYIKERRLIEEYAFKSVISISLKPYIDLVNEIEDNEDNKPYREFVVDVIKDIFISPLDKVFRTDHKELNKVLDQLNSSHHHHVESMNKNN